MNELTELDLSSKRNAANGTPMIFSCNSNKDLAERIALILKIKLGKSYTTVFPDGEIYTRIDETVRGRDCFVVQSTNPPVNDNLMELLIMIDTMCRASAKKVTAVIPYLSYLRQDRKNRPREPISARLVANLIERAGAARILTMDLHTEQIQGFFDIPVDNLVGAPIFLRHYKEKFGDDMSGIMVVSPDVGGIRRARNLANDLGTEFVIVDKRRPKHGVVEVMNIIGDVRGKRVIIVDDLVGTGGTLVSNAESLIEYGATEVYACCTHAILAGNATSRIQNSPIKELAVLNTAFIPMEKRIAKIKILSAANMFAQAIYKMHMDEPISVLYDSYMG